MKKNERLLFVGGVVLALALYWSTAAEGLPWNDSTHWALAYMGEIVRPDVLPHGLWGFFVQVFSGSFALAAVLAALAAGFLGLLVNRYLGWHLAASVILLWIFLPSTWYRVLGGEYGICLTSLAVIAAWALNALVLHVTRKARALRKEGGTLQAPSDANAKRGKWKRFVGWTVLTAKILFVLVSFTTHDYRFGESATVFARGIVEQAQNRIIVANGVCDDQLVREAKNPVVFMRNDDAYRSNLVAWVKATFANETNLWVAAQIGPSAFVDAAVQAHADRFYLMNGASTTRAAWEKRWTDFKPFLKSRDPFVRAARRMFAYEGNAVANATLDAAEKGGKDVPEEVGKTTYAFYKRISEEVDSGNISALANMQEMIRRGLYAASGEERKSVLDKLERFFKNPSNRQHARDIARLAGPVRTDPVILEQMAEEAKKRIAARIASGEKVDPSPEIMSLIEWNNEMVTLADKGEIDKAGRIARAILSNPKWKGFIPANAIMGAVSAKDGDYVASAAFFNTAVSTTNRIPVVTLNDYADVLMHLGRIDEAEKMARRAVAESDKTFWLARFTLAEVLLERPRDNAAVKQETRTLLQAALKNAPPRACERIRKLLHELDR